MQPAHSVAQEQKRERDHLFSDFLKIMMKAAFVNKYCSSSGGWLGRYFLTKLENFHLLRFRGCSHDLISFPGKKKQKTMFFERFKYIEEIQDLLLIGRNSLQKPCWSYSLTHQHLLFENVLGSTPFCNFYSEKHCIINFGRGYILLLPRPP